MALTARGGGKMTKEEIKQKTSLCFLLNPNIPEEEKICVIEKVMATKATIVSKASLCNIITYILKQNAGLKEQIEKMKCDILSLVKDRMNDDVDQNTIERLVEKWGIEENT